MSHDNRKKGCPNEVCDMHIKQTKMRANYLFCPICSTELVFVCSKCFKKINDEGPHHKYCALCEAKQIKPKPIKIAQDAIQQLSQMGEKAGDKIKHAGERVNSKIGRK